MIQTCESCEKDFITESDPYVVLPKPSGTVVMCLKCATSTAERRGWERCKEEAETIAENMDLDADSIYDAIAAMEYKP